MLLATGSGMIAMQNLDFSAAWVSTNDLPSGGSTAISAAVADLNGDGKPDLIVANWGSNNVGIALNTTPFLNSAIIETPYPYSILPSTSVTFQWAPCDNATAYWIDIGNVTGGNQYYQSGILNTKTRSATVSNLTANASKVYATMYSLIGNQWVSNAYSYTAYSNAASKGTLTTPAPGSTLTGSNVTFSWTAGSAALAYWIDVGSTAGGNQYFQSGNLGNVRTENVRGLPTDGSTLFVTLYSLIGGQWLSNAYTYSAYSGAGASGVLTTPAPGSTLTGSTVTFSWTAGAGAIAYWLDVGSTPGGNNYYQSGNLGGALATTSSGLPTNGSAVYVTLYSMVGGRWTGNAYIYTAFNASTGLAAMQSPTPGSVLSGNAATFTWTSGSATAYWLDIGSVPGGNTYYQSGNLGNALNASVSSLPADGSTIYVTLYSLIGGQWLNNSYTYTSGP